MLTQRLLLKNSQVEEMPRARYGGGVPSFPAPSRQATLPASPRAHHHGSSSDIVFLGSLGDSITQPRLIKSSTVINGDGDN